MINEIYDFFSPFIFDYNNQVMLIIKKSIDSKLVFVVCFALN